MEEKKNDRISKYLSDNIREMLFVELSPEYISRTGSEEYLTGVPVPMDAESVGTSDGISVSSVVINMARIIGGDPYFVYADKYISFIKFTAGENAVPMIISEGARSADSGDLEDACMLFRAALRIEPKSRDALYLYARACKEIYETEADSSEDGMGDGEKIGMFKAESTESFELLTMIHPDFALGYYFLGYAYLNMGLYLKAKLTWQEFLDHSSGSEMEINESDNDIIPALRDEIIGMIEELDGPVEIERGCNMIMSGDYQGGKEVLDGFRAGKYENWWPLWYYLGMSESALGHKDEAAECYKKVLRLSPANTDAMEELAAIYALSGDEVNAAKYRNKIEIVRHNLEEELDQ